MKTYRRNTTRRWVLTLLYTAVALIPLACFAGEPMQSIGKSFLKSYAGVCMEGFIVVVACVISGAPPDIDPSTGAVMYVTKYLTEYASWICIAGAIPFATCGFFSYNNLTLEKFLVAYIRSEWIVPQTRYYASENFHYKLIFAPNPAQKKKAKKNTKHKTTKE